MTSNNAGFSAAQQRQQGNRNPDGTWREGGAPKSESSVESLLRTGIADAEPLSAEVGYGFKEPDASGYLSPEQIAMNVYTGIHSYPWLVHGDPMRDLIAKGVRAGIEYEQARTAGKTEAGNQPVKTEPDGIDFEAIDAEIATLDDATETGAARMFELAAAATKAIALEMTADLDDDAAAVILEDINDDGGSPFFVVVSIQNAAGDTIFKSEDNECAAESFAEYAAMLDRDLDKLETVDRRQGLSKLTF